MTQAKTYVLIPADKRGLLTNWSAFNMGQYENSFSNLRDVLLRDNAWCSRTGDSSLGMAGVSGTCQALYVYNAIDTTTATANPTSTTVQSVGNSSPYGLSVTTQAGVTSAITTTVDPNDLVFMTIKNRVFVCGNGTTPLIITRYPAVNAFSWGKAGPTSSLSYTGYSQVSNANTKVFFEAAHGATTATLLTITGTGSTYTASPGWDGKTVIFDGSEIYTISTSTTNILTLTTPTPNTKATKNVEVHYGNLSWGVNPPKYAFAYYNPATGHITNISPILTLTEQNMSNVNVMIGGILGTGDANYTRIVLFRTGKDGGVLAPLFLDSAHGGTAVVGADGMIVNTASTYTYQDYQPDQKVGAVLGLFDAQYLIYNMPAPTDIRFAEYWNQRVFATTLSTPWRLIFSGDSGQIPLGVAEESWPSTNYRDVSATDGQITGLRVVGDSLLVCTNKAIYYVAGTNENDYNLVRLSSRGQGVNHFAIDEHPGDSTNPSSSAIYVSSDNRLWRHYPGGTVEDIGWPIQPFLDVVQRVGTNRPFLVKVAPLNKNWLLMLSIRNTGNTGYNTFFYDFDTTTWYDWGYGGVGSSTTATTFGAGFNYATNQNAVFATASTVPNLILVGYNTTAVGLQATFTTQAMDLGNRRDKKTIEGIDLYVSDDSLTGWGVQVRYDQAGSFVPYTRPPIINTPRYMGAGVIRFSCPAVQQFHSAELKVIWGTTNLATPKVFKAEIIYRTQSTGEGGEPS